MVEIKCPILSDYGIDLTGSEVSFCSAIYLTTWLSSNMTRLEIKVAIGTRIRGARKRVFTG